MTRVKTPDTDVPCGTCDGTGINQKPRDHECGACFGTGLSTASYDQRRNATTVGVEIEGEATEKTILAVVERGSVLEELKIEGFNRGWDKSRPNLYHVLISWKNKNYKFPNKSEGAAKS